MALSRWQDVQNQLTNSIDDRCDDYHHRHQHLIRHLSVYHHYPIPVTVVVFVVVMVSLKHMPFLYPINSATPKMNLTACYWDRTLQCTKKKKGQNVLLQAIRLNVDTDSIVPKSRPLLSLGSKKKKKTREKSIQMQGFCVRVTIFPLNPGGHWHLHGLSPPISTVG